MRRLFALICAGGFGCLSALGAIDLKECKFTQVVNDVQVISTTDDGKHAASVDGLFKMPDVLRTGTASRAELVAEDRTITRVGANTVFSFDRANRTINLQQGSLLFNSPKGKGGGTIHTAAATAAVLGTTLIVTTTTNGGFKVLNLEGVVEVRFDNGTHRTLHSGPIDLCAAGRRDWTNRVVPSGSTGCQQQVGVGFPATPPVLAHDHRPDRPTSPADPYRSGTGYRHAGR